MKSLSPTAKVVVFGWGNVTRSDDAIGPHLMQRIEGEGLAHVTAIEDFQLQIEHALDLDGQDLALFIDAGFETPAPFFFAETAARPYMTHSSHGLQPEAVLDVYAKVRGRPAPPAFVLCVRGETFEVGEGLSPEAAARLDAAWCFLLSRLRAPSLAAWRAATVNRGAALATG